MAGLKQRLDNNIVLIATGLATIVALGTFFVPLITKVLTLENCIYAALFTTLGAIVVSVVASLFSRKALTFLGAFILACGCIMIIGCRLSPWPDVLDGVALICLLGGMFLTIYSPTYYLGPDSPLKARWLFGVGIEFLLIVLIIEAVKRIS